jgi:hypothetical protein
MIHPIFVTLNNPLDLKNTLRSLQDVDVLLSGMTLIDSSQDTLCKAIWDEELVTVPNKNYLWTEPMGIYSAMNHGLAFPADEELIWFLNPGDVLVSKEALKSLSDSSKGNSFSWGFGQALIEGRTIFPSSDFPESHMQLQSLLRGDLSISHQAMLVKCDIIRHFGFDESYQICADLKLQSLLINEFIPHFVRHPIVALDSSGVSHQRLLRTYLETAKIRFRVGGWNPFHALFFTLRNLFFIKFQTILKFGCRT